MSARPVLYLAAMSPYSWIAAERADRVLPGAIWRPVTAAFIFRAAGRTSWGLTDEREAGIAGCEARAAERGLGPIRWPEPWPTSDIPVARAMVSADRAGRLRDYALSAMRMAFLEGADLSLAASVAEAAERAGMSGAGMLESIATAEIKDALRAATGEASALGVFGVPTVQVGDQLFWGDDRLEDAAAAAAG